MPYESVNGFRHDRPERIGLLVTNLGTPDAPTTSAVRRYLAQFLADPRVVERPRWLWLPILHGIILRIRPRRSAHAYSLVWEDEGSPLLRHSRRIADLVGAALAGNGASAPLVALGMRYGNPSIESALTELRDAGATRIAVLPLFPHYSGSTTGSAFDEVARVLSGWRWVPALRFLTSYHDDPRFIDALAASAEAHWSGHGRPDRLLMSFHGLPRSYLESGDPYHCQCHATARLLAARLELPDDGWAISFQSRVGPDEWLRPYTDETLESWGREGVGRVDVICPGFAADCLETLEEIAMQGAESFREAGGGTLGYIPALNDRDDHIGLLAGLAGEEMGGWLTAPPTSDPGALARRAARAKTLGAPG